MSPGRDAIPGEGRRPVVTRRHVLRASLALGLTLGGGVASRLASGRPAAGPRSILIGTGRLMKPYCYVDEDDRPAGYEIDVLNRINALLPQYRFEIIQQEFVNILMDLRAGKIDVAAHQYERNAEREKAFLFADEGYTNYVLHLVVRRDRDDVAGLSDLAGKTVSVEPGSNTAYLVELYNARHGNAIAVRYASGVTALSYVADVVDGRTDAVILLKRTVEELNRTFGNHLKIVGPPLSTSHAFHLFRKDGTGLKSDFDSALRLLKRDGTLQQLSVASLGGNFVDEE
ncbi:MAG: transporter substrate-binding domain-containing protein [Telmatospirillum sp.]|nr:transporter substrate-binding domain-containing protein [Telmatospirillum sp.]